MNKLREIVRELAQRTYDDSREQGVKRRRYLLENGLPLETMSTNTYRGKTFVGLYAYLEGMKV
jgi:hypothetical protein